MHLDVASLYYKRLFCHSIFISHYTLLVLYQSYQSYTTVTLILIQSGLPALQPNLLQYRLKLCTRLPQESWHISNCVWHYEKGKLVLVLQQSRLIYGAISANYIEKAAQYFFNTLCPRKLIIHFDF